ncbi:MAG: hypothetical protein Q9160_002052 [Pyrenula sp. 1 TL-2023]
MDRSGFSSSGQNLTLNTSVEDESIQSTDARERISEAHNSLQAILASARAQETLKEESQDASSQSDTVSTQPPLSPFSRTKRLLALRQNPPLPRSGASSTSSSEDAYSSWPGPPTQDPGPSSRSKPPRQAAQKSAPSRSFFGPLRKFILSITPSARSKKPATAAPPASLKTSQRPPQPTSTYHVGRVPAPPFFSSPAAPVFTGPEVSSATSNDDIHPTNRRPDPVQPGSEILDPTPREEVVTVIGPELSFCPTYAQLLEAVSPWLCPVHAALGGLASTGAGGGEVQDGDVESDEEEVVRGDKEKGKATDEMEEDGAGG